MHYEATKVLMQPILKDWRCHRSYWMDCHPCQVTNTRSWHDFDTIFISLHNYIIMLLTHSSYRFSCLTSWQRAKAAHIFRFRRAHSLAMLQFSLILRFTYIFNKFECETLHQLFGFTRFYLTYVDFLHFDLLIRVQFLPRKAHHSTIYDLRVRVKIVYCQISTKEWR